MIKRSRWLLLHIPENLPERYEVRLSELLEANQPLNTVYVMKTALKQFAEKVREYVSRIIASARNWLNTSILEGMNNKIIKIQFR
ncbi:hypothetical protein GM30_14995 [Trabulsiella odontotermitis]|nr:hypothetical protein GM30_14995 [Trabulsiella odontotermitis]